jgi:hypothetical protein
MIRVTDVSLKAMTWIRAVHEIICDRDDAAFASAVLAAVVKRDRVFVCIHRGNGTCSIVDNLWL